MSSPSGGGNGGNSEMRFGSLLGTLVLPPRSPALLDYETYEPKTTAGETHAPHIGKLFGRPPPSLGSNTAPRAHTATHRTQPRMGIPSRALQVAFC